MSILVDFEIAEAVRQGRLIIDPFESGLVQPNSYDVTLAERFSWHDRSDALIDPYDSRSVLEGLVTVQQDSIIMQPGDFILAATREAVSLPKDIVGQLTGKSSLARLGIMVHVTAGFIDAGFSDPPAQITLEIVNLGNRPVKLYAGMPIGQIVFTATQECQVSYSQKPGAKYNGQPAAAHSRYYLNKV